MTGNLTEEIIQSTSPNRHSMKNIFRDFLYFSRQERRGVLLLCLLILLAMGGKTIYLHDHPKSKHMTGEDTIQQTARQQTYKVFKDSLLPQRKHREQPDFSQQQPALPLLTPFPFDPNTADSTLLCRLGLPDWMAHNIVRYREKGGKFRKPEDFQKIYGLTEEQFNTLLPYIRIAPGKEEKAPMPQLLVRQETDSIERPFKYPAGTVIELNRADTTELKKIPGIGSGIARLIAGYRHQLGGFYCIEQLQEINLDCEQLRSWFRIDTAAIQRLNLNKAGIERLRNHPYLDFYQARAIVEWRKKNGKLHSLKPFRLYEEFTEEDFQKLAPYVCFE